MGLMRAKTCARPAKVRPLSSEDMPFDKTPCTFIGSPIAVRSFLWPQRESRSRRRSIRASPWKLNMTPGRSEAAYDQINSSATFTYSLQFTGQLGYLVLDDLRRTTRYFFRRLFLLGISW